MKNIERKFILTGLVFLLAGMALGLKMAISQDFGMHGLHAHLNLLGFVLMTLFGLCYRAWPKMQESKLATLHYWLHTVTVATAMTIFYFLLSDLSRAPKLGPIMEYFLMGTYAGILLFAYLFYTRARD